MSQSATAFFSAIEAIGRANAPVEQWHPPLCGYLDLTIQADGQWVMQGRPIARRRLTQLYATVLKREGDEYYLVTPVEKWRITVVDLPFVIVEINAISRSGMADVLSCRTNLGEWIEINNQHPLASSPVADGDGQPIPTISVRDGLAARFNRSSYYELVNLSTTVNDTALLVCSGNYQQLLSLVTSSTL